MARTRAELPLLALLALLSAACVRAACPTQQSQDVFMGLINEQRAVHGSPPLVWNDTLAAQAQEWSNACIGEHSEVAPGANYGETMLWALNKDGIDAESGLDVCSYAAAQWYTEINFYDWARADSNPAKSPSFDPDESTGNFAQVVWQGSTSVGCGVTECVNPFNAGPLTLVTCRYHPSGTAFKQHVFRTACQNRTGDDGCSSCSSSGACLACFSGLNFYPNPSTGRCRPSPGGDASSGGIPIPTRPSGDSPVKPPPGTPPNVVPGVPVIPDIPDRPGLGPDVAPSVAPSVAPGPGPGVAPGVAPAMEPADPPVAVDPGMEPGMGPSPSSPSVADPPEGSGGSPASPSPSPGTPSAAPGSPSPSPESASPSPDGGGGESPSPSPDTASPSPDDGGGGGESPSRTVEGSTGDSPSPDLEPSSPSPDDGGGDGESPSPESDGGGGESPSPEGDGGGGESPSPEPEGGGESPSPV